jgi:hypothetical protein
VLLLQVPTVPTMRDAKNVLAVIPRVYLDFLPEAKNIITVMSGRKNTTFAKFIAAVGAPICHAILRLADKPLVLVLKCRLDLRVVSGDAGRGDFQRGKIVGVYTVVANHTVK